MISKELVYIGDFAEEAKKLSAHFGTTDLFSTGHHKFDKYIGGGYGRQDGYEIVVLYGPTGIGKSLISLNMIAPAIKNGSQIGLMILEDDMADASLRLSYILDEYSYNKMNNDTNVRCIPQESLVKSWNLNDLLQLIEDWFNEGIELIILDHLQFAFEGAESIKGENEYAAQRVFMQKLNQLMKRVKKTIILISHMNKDSSAKGLNKIVGSSAIAQAATKVIEVNKDKDSGNTVMKMHKSRFTATPDDSHFMKLTGTKLEEL